MSFYPVIAQTVLRMISEKGAAGVLTLVEKGAYDPKTSTVASISTPVVVSALVTSYKVQDIDGVLVLRTDKRVLVPAAGVPREPRPGDRLECQGRVFGVVSCEPLQPGEVPLFYAIQGRA